MNHVVCLLFVLYNIHTTQTRSKRFITMSQIKKVERYSYNGVDYHTEEQARIAQNLTMTKEGIYNIFKENDLTYIKQIDRIIDVIINNREKISKMIG